ncbi:MAG: ATP-binding protein [Amphritea sp.]
MKYFNRNKFEGICRQVLLITLLPLLIMTLILAGYFISTRIADNETALIERGETVSRLMAEASEFGIISGLTHQLSALSKGPIHEKDIADVIFMNQQGHAIFRSTDIPLDISPSREAYNDQQGSYWLFLTPVFTTGILVQNLPEYPVTDDERQLLGWVVVVLSTQPMQERQKQIITNSLILLFSGLFATFIVALRYGDTLTQPIIQLTDVVKQLEEGKLSSRIVEKSDAELGSLERGINLLGERIQTSNQRLESQVDKATQRLRKTLRHLETQNIALQKARQRADRANLAKDEFLARMSHELRTPLTSVLGFTSMLRQTELSFEQQEHCRIINQTSTTLLSIIDDILDFAKLQSEAIELEKIIFNPEKTIHEALEMQSHSAATKGLELAYLVDNDAQFDMLGDPTRLRQIATNLISNAIKFTKQGHIIVSLKIIGKSPDAVQFELNVKDSGIGISAEQKRGLFNAFSQADSSITRRFGGSGLGLVIVQKLVKLMHGQIHLDSAPGKGTEFSCTFKCKRLIEQPSANDIDKIKQTTELVIFDRHPAGLKSLVGLCENSATRVQQCATLPELLNTIKYVDSITSSLIFGVSANPDIAKQQKLKIPKLFASFKGNILLVAPALGADISELMENSSHNNVSVTTKPLSRTLVNKWLNNRTLEDKHDGSNINKPIFNSQTHVVIAEDNDFNRLLLRRIVEAAGARVSEARTGKEAVHLTYQHHPDAVLMDVHMPIMDGIEATSKIRDSFSHLPIIALTANVISSEEHALKQAGVTRIEYKPINDHKLINLLKQLCQTRSGKKESHPITPLLAFASADRVASTSINKYKLSKEELHQEITQQLEAIQHAFSLSDKNLMGQHIHQLTGLAGLFALPELELTSVELNQAVKEKGFKAIWQLLWRLERLIKHHQYLDD